MFSICTWELSLQSIFTVCYLNSACLTHGSRLAKTIEPSPGFAKSKTKGRGALRSARSSCIDRSSPPDHPAPYDTRLGGSEAWLGMAATEEPVAAGETQQNM